jgi:predicted KAP-like P-loop ATPase
MVKSILSIIRDDTLLPSSIGIFGDWGSGKSSLMKMISNELESDTNNLCVSFNGWLFEGYDDAKSALLGTILDTIVLKKTPKAKALDIITGLYKSISVFKLIKLGLSFGSAYLSQSVDTSAAALQIADGVSTLGEVAASAKSQIKNEVTFAKLRNDLTSFRVSFQEALSETKIKRLIVFIDELDRCNPSTIIETLEAIRLFLFIGNTTFVIGADERHIAYAIKSKYKDIDEKKFNIGKEYLEKMIQYPFRIPKLSEDEVELFISLLLTEKTLNEKEYREFIEYVRAKQKHNALRIKLDLVDVQRALPKTYNRISENLVLSKQISPMLTNGFKGNPRQCKRFLNMLEMRKRTAQLYGLAINIQLLVKLMILEYFSEFYDELEILVMQNKLDQILEVVEKDGFKAIEKYKTKFDDTWHRNWIALKPSLVGNDLEPYVFLARDQREKSEYQTYHSSIKEELISNILSDSETISMKTIDLLKNMNIDEAKSIYQQLFETVLSNSVIPVKSFKAFMNTALACSLTKEALVYLEQFDSSQISLGVLPYLNKIDIDSTTNIHLKRILLKWQSSNDKLKRFSLDEKGE